MKLGKLITAAAIAALPLAAQAAQIIVPAAGSGPGANGSQWQSELTLHSAAPRAITLAISFHQNAGVTGPVNVMLNPRETTSIADIVRTKFNVTGTGALVIDVADRDARALAVTSRTSNILGDTEFGQDILAVDAVNALRAGDNAALPGPAVTGATRFNFGVYALEPATIEWQVVRANGTVAGSKTVTYAAGNHAQYNSGIETLVGVAPQNNDTLYARIAQGRAVVYGSIINATGDPTFVPGIRTRGDIIINFAGIDLDENGTVDLVDADGDGVLDATIDVVTSLFDTYFRVIAKGEFGENVQLEVVSSPADTAFLDASGTLRVSAASSVKGQTGEIRVKATSGDASQIFTIPVRFK